MTRAMIFWLIFILCVLAYFGVFFFWNEGPMTSYQWRAGAPGLMSLLLIGLLGWQVYGPAIKG